MKTTSKSKTTSKIKTTSKMKITSKMKMTTKVKMTSKMRTTSRWNEANAPVWVSHGIKEVEEMARNPVAPQMKRVQRGEQGNWSRVPVFKNSGNCLNNSRDQVYVLPKPCPSKAFSADIFRSLSLDSWQGPQNASHQNWTGFLELVELGVVVKVHHVLERQAGPGSILVLQDPLGF